MKKLLSFAAAVTVAALCGAEWKGELQDWYRKYFYRNLISVKNLPDAGAVYPAVTVEFTTPHRYTNTDTFFAHLEFPQMLDLSKMRRVKGVFQANTPQGYRSGKVMLTLTDQSGKKVSYMINKEFYRAEKPVLWEHKLTGFPKGFDPAKIKKITLHGSTPSNAGKGKITFSKLEFDHREPFETAENNRKIFAAQQEKSPAGAFKLYAASPEELIFPWGMEKTPDGSAKNLIAARGGSGDLQIMIIPGKNFPGGKVPVKFAAFTGKNGTTLNLSESRIYSLLFSSTAPKGEKEEIFANRFPDILKPVENGEITITPQEANAVFAEIKVPADTPAGTYQGAVIIGKEKLPVSLKVYPFTLKKRPALKSSFWFFPNRIPRSKTASGEVTMQEIKPYLDAALRARVTPVLADENLSFGAFKVKKSVDGSYSVNLDKLMEFYRYVMANGGNAVQLGDSHWFGKYFYNRRTTFIPGEEKSDQKIQLPGKVAPHREQIFRSYLNSALKEIAKEKWEEFVYIQLWDEANSDAEKNILPVIYPLMREFSAKVPVLITRGKVAPEYLNVIMCPTMPAVDAGIGKNRDAAKNYREKDQNFWYYGCSDVGLTLLENPVRNRLFPLYGVNGRAEGFLFWSLNRYLPGEFADFPAKDYQGYRKPMGINDSLGDGNLIYPPAPGSKLAMPTLRLMLFKAGMEDAEAMLALPERAVLDKELLECWENPAKAAALREFLLEKLK